jgi:hypothetical protein
MCAISGWWLSNILFYQSRSLLLFWRIVYCRCFVNRTSKFKRMSRCSRKTMVAFKRHKDLYNRDLCCFFRELFMLLFCCQLYFLYCDQIISTNINFSTTYVHMGSIGKWSPYILLQALPLEPWDGGCKDHGNEKLSMVMKTEKMEAKAQIQRYMDRVFVSPAKVL